LAESPDNKAIYVGFNHNGAGKFFNRINKENQKQFLCFSVGGQDGAFSDAEYVLLPK
jgi:hypothetical protein